ncbi:putative membrane protein [Lasiodiplodia hormozganensis]|uniref:Membrane protein n=1 Tax=Lasiodiplodia hormozganensis TaxID=869390 RepID=A0AA39YNQ0_9PEZI|nr:putative membrane protein [Lasiodiplodia hormozganensis]
MSSDAAPVVPPPAAAAAAANEPPAPVAPQSAQAPPKQDPVGLSVELDEFGLPIRKKPLRRLISEDSEENLRRSVEEAQHQETASGNAWGATAPAAPASASASPTPQGNAHDDDVAVKVDAKSAPSGELATAQSDDKRAEATPDVLAEASASDHRYAEPGAVSEWSYQQLAPKKEKKDDDWDGEWQDMPAYASYDMYNDDNKLIAREKDDFSDEEVEYGALGGAGRGYTRVQIDEDAQSATSMDDNTAYLFKGGKSTNVQDDDEEARDPLSQMQATKDLLTEGQRIAYVGVVRLSMLEMVKELEKLERTKASKKQVDMSSEAMKMWSQKMMVRLYSHMEIESAEQIMIEQLGEHGVQPSDLTPALMQNARVKNPVAEETASSRPSVSSPRPSSTSSAPSTPVPDTPGSSAPPPYEDHGGEDMPEVRTPSQLPTTKNIDIDLRWTVLCDLFLVLIADSVYDARSREVLEKVGKYLEVPDLDICRFEKRVTDALEMQEAANDQNWSDEGHLESRAKMQRNRRLVMMGLATVGGGLVIGLSAGLLAPVIGAGLAAGFTTIGVAGTSSFLAGAGGAAIITTTGVVTGSTVGVRASNRRTGAVKTFEYRPLHNNKRVNMVITVSGWMNGKVDDVRLPFSTVDPVMGDIYSVFWEPEMLQSMGQTINILATEALTQGLQQVLGSTILVALMGALQLPIVLTKLSYLIDNPWNVSLARAELAGLILADSLIDRNLGVRPATLVGFSLGSRVIFSCLQELSKRGAYGLVQNVFLFGSPMVAKKDEYLKARSVVAGRFVNGYATNDWILGYLFRATSGGVMKVAGLAPVDCPGIENFDVTEMVNGHMAYRAAIPRLLREMGWAVESDEFAEIEDPDPDNHEARQRELINEIEEARKEMEQKPQRKSGWNFFKKKQAEKKEWEMYDEKMRAGDDDKNKNVLFDVEAIKQEAAEIAAQGIETQSFNDSTIDHNQGSKTAHLYDGSEYDANPDRWEGDISMTFDTSYETPPASSHGAVHTGSTWSSPSVERPPLRTSSTLPVNLASFEHNAWADDDEAEWGKEKEMKMTFE